MNSIIFEEKNPFTLPPSLYRCLHLRSRHPVSSPVFFFVPTTLVLVDVDVVLFVSASCEPLWPALFQKRYGVDAGGTTKLELKLKLNLIEYFYGSLVSLIVRATIQQQQSKRLTPKASRARARVRAETNNNNNNNKQNKHPRLPD